MQKFLGMNFLGRVFVGSHRGRRGRGGIPLSRTEGAEVAEAFYYLAQRAQRTGRHSIISHRGRRGRGGIRKEPQHAAALSNSFPLPTSNLSHSPAYGILHGASVVTVPSGQVVLFHTTPVRLAPVRSMLVRSASVRSADGPIR